MFKHQRGRYIAGTIFLALSTPLPIHAGLISSDILINAQVALSDLSSPASSDGTQSGSLNFISGGVSSSSSISDVTVSGANPLGGALTHTGDGVGINFNASGQEGPSENTATNFFGDYAMSFQNNSLTSDYKITLGFGFENMVNLTGSPGDDVFAEAEMFLRSPSEELFFTYRVVDYIFGDDETDASGLLFDIILGAGQHLELSGQQDIIAAAVDFATGYEVTLNTFISVLDVTALTPPPVVVGEPPLLVLMLSGWLLVAVQSKNRTIRAHNTAAQDVLHQE